MLYSERIERMQGVCDSRSVGHEKAPGRMQSTVVFTVTVQEKDALSVRRAMSASGMSFLRAIRVPKNGRMRLQIGMPEDRVGEAMSRVMASVDDAEFGRVIARS